MNKHTNQRVAAAFQVVAVLDIHEPFEIIDIQIGVVDTPDRELKNQIVP